MLTHVGTERTDRQTGGSAQVLMVSGLRFVSEEKLKPSHHVAQQLALRLIQRHPATTLRQKPQRDLKRMSRIEHAD
jgi:hypothetical protein